MLASEGWLIPVGQHPRQQGSKDTNLMPSLIQCRVSMCALTALTSISPYKATIGKACAYVNPQTFS